MNQDKSLLFSLSFVSILALYNFDAMADKLICPGGKMVPVNGDRCIDCNEKNLLENMPEKSGFDNIFCPGGLFDFGVEKIQGVYTCKNGKVADSAHKKCVEQSDAEPRAEETKHVIARAATVNKSTELNRAASKTRKTCNAGQYLPANATSCTSCRDRYYCPGGTFTVASFDQGLKTCVNSQPNAERTACVISCSAGNYLPSRMSSCSSCRDRYYCPGGTFIVGTNTYDQGLKSCLFDTVPNSSKTACVSNQSKAQSSAKYTCKAGQYLPANATSCKDCKDRYYACSGGTFSVASFNQGIIKCSSGLVPDSTKTKCEDPDKDKIYCKGGTYLPAGKDICVDCLDGYYCEGGKWTPDPSMNQGLLKCASGMISNATKTSCKKPDDLDCKPGYYIPAKATSCKQCSGSLKYCPGVNGKPSDVDQGIYTCPDKSSPNADKTSCVLKLDKSMMQYGPGGQTVALGEQCWGKLTADEYTKCMFGGKVKLPGGESN